jgi:hypothetical protein
VKLFEYVHLIKRRWRTPNRTASERYYAGADCP